MRIDASTDLRSLAFLVGDALHKAGKTAVLTGGSAATFYAPEVYQSRDLDFVFEYWSAFDVDDGPMLALGFERRGRTFVHPATLYTVDFPQGPLAIGNDEEIGWDTQVENGLTLHLLSPTDSVRDRLAWYFQENDWSSLEQALGVALAQPIQLAAIERWARNEGEASKYANFEARYLAEKDLR